MPPRTRSAPLRKPAALLLVLAPALGACGASDAPEVAAAGPEPGAPIEVPEGMEGFAHLLNPNKRGVTQTNGMNKLEAGWTTDWHKNGVIQGEGEIDADGKRTGPWTFWFDNGIKRWEGTYASDEVVGRERSWYDDGSPHFEGAYVDGKREGLWSYWRPNGRPHWRGHFEAGKRHGRYVEWTAEGEIDLELSGIYEQSRKVSAYAPPAGNAGDWPTAQSAIGSTVAGE